MNFATTKLFFAPTPARALQPGAGARPGVAVRAIHNRPKWNSEHPSLAENFGSANSLLYSYHDYELADTVALLRGQQLRDRDRPLQPDLRQDSKKVVIDPRTHRSAQNAIDTGGVHLQLKPNTDVVLINSLMNVILGEGLQDQAFIDARVRPASFAALKATVTQAKYTPENTAGRHRRPGGQGAPGGEAAGQAQEDVHPLREGRDLVGDAERGR